MLYNGSRKDFGNGELIIRWKMGDEKSIRYNRMSYENWILNDSYGIYIKWDEKMTIYTAKCRMNLRKKAFHTTFFAFLTIYVV